MRKSAILALVSASILMLVFNAAGDTASVVVSMNGGCTPDVNHCGVTISANENALELLDSVCNITYVDTSWGPFVTTIEGKEAVWNPPTSEDWWMFTVQDDDDCCPVMASVGLSNYTVQDGDIIGMWFVSGNCSSWADCTNCSCPPCITCT